MQVRKEKRIEMAEQRRAEKSAKEENKQLQELRSYKGLMQVGIIRDLLSHANLQAICCEIW